MDPGLRSGRARGFPAERPQECRDYYLLSMFSGILTATTRPFAQILPLADSVSLTTTFLPDTSSILPRISSGTPGDNTHCEAFNSLVRRECLTLHYFLDIKDASTVLGSWKEDYNNDRPHGSLDQLTPARYRAGWIKRNDPERLANYI